MVGTVNLVLVTHLEFYIFLLRAYVLFVLSFKACFFNIFRKIQTCKCYDQVLFNIVNITIMTSHNTFYKIADIRIGGLSQTHAIRR